MTLDRTATLIVLGLFAGAAGISACDTRLCRPTAMSAATRIIGAWCERRLQCGDPAPTVQSCMDERIARSYVPDDAECGVCGEDEDGLDCARSTCDDDKVARCVEEIRAADCAWLVDPTFGTVRYPAGCEGCFR